VRGIFKPRERRGGGDFVFKDFDGLFCFTFDDCANAI